MVQPSCPVLVIHDDDAFRKSLIAALDSQHFTVSITADDDAALSHLSGRAFLVVIVGLNLATNRGAQALERLREVKSHGNCAVLIVGDPDPRLRTFAPWADETLLKPVDPAYVASRARSYCNRG